MKLFVQPARLLAASFVLAVGIASGAAPAGEAWPSRPVRLVVGYPAGTSPDLVARAIQPALSQALGQPVVIENKPGAGGNIGVDQVVRATDGHTFGITTNGPLTTSQKLYPKLPYNVAKDIKPLSFAATSAQVLVIDTNVPANTAKDYVAWGKAQRDGVTFGSIGVGTGSHLTMELFARSAGVKMLHVPYQGFPQITAAMIAHDLQSAFMAPSGALEQANAGKVRVLGISSAQRSPQFPDVPTIAEAAGLPGFNAELWIAAFAPASMPPETAARLAKQINAVLQRPDVRAQLAAQGWEARGESPQALARRIAEDTRLWGQVIEQANVRLE